MNQIDNLIELTDNYCTSCLRQAGANKFSIRKTSSDKIDLTDLNDFSYSAIMRDLRKQCDEETVREFLLIYKMCFDMLINNDVVKAGEIALIFAVDLFNSLHPLKLKVEKVANASDLGDAPLAGQYLANIIKFTLNRVDPDKRAKALHTVLRKIYFLDENVLGGKQMPASSSIGQSISFVKNVLIGNEPQYIRAVINNVVANLR